MRYPLVLFGVGCGRHEDRFANSATGGELVGLDRTVGQVVLEESVGNPVVERQGGLEVVGDHRAVPVAVPATHQAVIDARELLDPVIQPLQGHLGVVGVDDPPVQGNQRRRR